MLEPTPTHDKALPRRYADFDTLVDAVDYAAQGTKGLNFYSARGQLSEVASYAILREQAIAVGQRLIYLGLEKEARVAIIADTSADFVAFFLGCQYASVLPVPLPLPTSFGGREGYCQQLNTQMKSCGASVVVSPEAMVSLVEDAVTDLDLKFFGTPDNFRELPLGPKSGPVDVRLPDADDLAYLQYSSGSTRFPHGVAVTHRSLMANCNGMGEHGVKLTDEDRCVSWLPFYHDMGLVGCLMTPLTCQVSVDYLATEDFARRPMQWLSLISRNRGTVSYSPTFGYDICSRRVGAEALASLDLSSWRVAGIGGDMIRADVLGNFCEAFAAAGFDERALVPSYGLAECTLAVSFMPLNTGIKIDMVDEKVLAGEYNALSAVAKKAVNGHANGHANGTIYRAVVNCGVPLPGYEVEIRDKAGNALEDYEIGAIVLRGPSVMREYYNDMQATKEALSDDGWLDTGDMGYRIGESLFIIGRFKDMIIINGRNHWPQDIEWAVEQLPGIRSGDTAAISLPGLNAEEVPTVLVQCRVQDDEERQAFQNMVREKIQQAVGVACDVVLVRPRTLPRTSSGKLSRSKARINYLSGALAAN